MPSQSTYTPVPRGWFAWVVLAAAGLCWLYAWSPASFTVRWLTGGPTTYYHELADALLDGRLHLARTPDPQLIALPDPYDPAANAPYRVNDLSYFQGRYYLYHSAVPALVLVAPVRLVTGRYLSDAAASLVFTLTGVAAALALLDGMRRKLFPRSSVALVAACAVALALAQGYQVVLRAGTLNQVPIAAAYCFLMLALLCLWRALQSAWPDWRWQSLASLAYGLAVASRPNYLFGALALLAPVFLAWSRDVFPLSGRFLRPALAASIPLVLVIAALLAYNAARFHDPLEFGMRHMLGGWDQRALPSLGIDSFGTNAFFYLVAPGDYHATFPFVTAPSWLAIGLLWHTPFVWLMLFLPLAARHSVFTSQGTARGFIFALLWIGGANLVTLLLLPSGNAAQIATSANARYILDFQPVLILLASLGALAAGEYLAVSPGPRRLLISVTLLLALVSIGVGISLDFQRYPPEAYRPLARWLNQPAWWWEQMHGVTYGPIELRVILPTDKIGGYEPLLATGTATAGDLVYIHYVDPGHIRIGLVGIGTPGPLSELIPLDYTQPHRIEFHIGSLYPLINHPALSVYSDAQVATLKRRLLVRLDGQSVLEAPVFFHTAAPDSMRTGEAPFLLDYCAPKFNGHILAVQRLPLPSRVTETASPGYGAVQLQLHFPSNRDGRTEPLVSTGIPQAGDLLSISYQGNRAVRFNFDHWGHRGAATDWLPVDFTAVHTLEVSFDSLFATSSPRRREQLQIILDGRMVLDVLQPAYASSPYDVVIGRNVIGSSTASYAFTGRILRLSRPPPAP